MGDDIDKELSEAFEANPTIANYVKLRRSNPNKEIEVAISGGLDWLLANENTLEKHGIEPRLFAKTLDANLQAISELCLQLLEKITERENAEAAGETHLIGRDKAISNSLVNYLIAAMLDALSWNDELNIPRDLIVLVRHQLGGGHNSTILKRQRSREIKMQVIFIGAQLLESEETLSARKIASILNVNVSTISRMYPENTLIHESAEILETMKSVMSSQTPFADIARKRVQKTPSE